MAGRWRHYRILFSIIQKRKIKHKGENTTKTIITKIEVNTVGVPIRWVLGVPSNYNTVLDVKFFVYDLELPENAEVGENCFDEKMIFVNEKYAEIVGFNKRTVRLVTAESIFPVTICEIKDEKEIMKL